MGVKSTSILFILMTMSPYVQCEWFNFKPCEVEEAPNARRCTFVYNCNATIFFLSPRFPSVPCMRHYIIYNFRNLKSNTYENQIYRLPADENIVKIILTQFDMNTIPNEMLSHDQIQHFEITYSSLEVIDISKFGNKPKLVSINASHNRISLLSTADRQDFTMNSLQIIDYSFNLIQTIPDDYFKAFSNLTNLNLSHNIINNIQISTFEGLYNLQTLDLSYNNLVTLGYTFLKLVKLRELLLNNNAIRSLSKSNFNVMIYLEILNLSFNNIENIEDRTFQSLIKLDNLDLSSNAIPVLSNELFRNITKLEYICLSNNYIKMIPHDIFNGHNVKKFKINNNSISGIIDNNTFHGIIGADFDLSNNKINKVASGAFYSFGTDFKRLNLSHNNIQNISNSAFPSLNSLITLDISYNRLEIVDGFLNNMTMIEHLNVTNNSLKRLLKKSFLGAISLVTLDLSFNFIKDIEDGSFDDLENLETLILSNNPLTVVFTANIFRGMKNLKNIFITNTEVTSYEKYTFSGMTNLKIMNASYGGLQLLNCDAFNGIISTEILDMSYNLLELFILKNNSLSELRELYLHNNRIKNITPQMFNSFPKLIKLTLASNNIVQVQDDSFSSLMKLKYLDLSNNVLMVMNSSQIGKMASLYSLSIRNVRTFYNFSSVNTASINVLDMSFSGIVDVKSRLVYKLLNLTQLNLNSNKITQIDVYSFQTMPVLSYLDLSSNHIKYIQPGTFIHTNLITYLDLNNNEISVLHHGVFDGLQDLRYLNLSSNFLSSFEINILHKSLELSSIVLDDNYIKSMNFDSLDVRKTEELSIGGNLFSCDVLVDFKSHKHSFKLTAQTLDYHSENVDGVTCTSSSRDNLNNITVQNVTFSFNSLKNSIDLLRDTISHTNVSAPFYIALCCLVILFCVCSVLSYSYFKRRSRVMEVNEFSSVRHLASDIEME